MALSFGTPSAAASVTPSVPLSFGGVPEPTNNTFFGFSLPSSLSFGTVEPKPTLSPASVAAYQQYGATREVARVTASPEINPISAYQQYGTSRTIANQQAAETVTVGSLDGAMQTVGNLSNTLQNILGAIGSTGDQTAAQVTPVSYAEPAASGLSPWVIVAAVAGLAAVGYAVWKK